MLFTGGSGSDTVEGRTGVDVINGGPGDDLLCSDIQIGQGVCTNFTDTEGESVLGGPGNDKIGVGDGDRADGGTDNDIINVGSNSTAFGGSGDDFIAGGSDSVLDGEEGNDHLVGGSSMFGGSGDDTLDISSVNAFVDGGSGDNTYRFYGLGVLDGTRFSGFDASVSSNILVSQNFAPYTPLTDIVSPIYDFNSSIDILTVSIPKLGSLSKIGLQDTSIKFTIENFHNLDATHGMYGLPHIAAAPDMPASPFINAPGAGNYNLYLPSVHR